MKNPLIKTSLAALMITGLAACSAVTPPNQSGMTTARNAAIGAAVGAAAGNLWTRLKHPQRCVLPYGHAAFLFVATLSVDVTPTSATRTSPALH